jgi:hypothetical protein
MNAKSELEYRSIRIRRVAYFAEFIAKFSYTANETSRGRADFAMNHTNLVPRHRRHFSAHTPKKTLAWNRQRSRD